MAAARNKLKCAFIFPDSDRIHAIEPAEGETISGTLEIWNNKGWNCERVFHIQHMPAKFARKNIAMYRVRHRERGYEWNVIFISPPVAPRTRYGARKKETV